MRTGPEPIDLIDLTMPLDAATPVYPGDPAVVIDVTATFEEAGYHNTRVTLGAHHGTHIDAEGHMIPGGRMLDAYPLDRFHGRGIVLDVRGGEGGVDVAAIAKAETEGARVDAESIVLLRTGMSDACAAPGYYSRVPDLPEALVDLLIARGVKMVGVDAGSIDAAPFAVHKALLSHGILIAENLVGLGALAARAGTGVGAGTAPGAAGGAFAVWALPLNLRTEASPARVLAALPRTAG